MSQTAARRRYDRFAVVSSFARCVAYNKECMRWALASLRVCSTTHTAVYARYRCQHDNMYTCSFCVNHVLVHENKEELTGEFCHVPCLAPEDNVTNATFRTTYALCGKNAKIYGFKLLVRCGRDGAIGKIHKRRHADAQRPYKGGKSMKWWNNTRFVRHALVIR